MLAVLVSDTLIDNDKISTDISYNNVNCTDNLVCLDICQSVEMPFNSEGNYIDENAGVVYHEQSVSVYGVITIFLLFFTALAGFFNERNL